MSTENIAAFEQKLQATPSLQAGILELQKATQQKLADQMAALSAEQSLPFTAGEFLRFQTSELSDESLTEVAGGLFELSRNHTRLY